MKKIALLTLILSLNGCSSFITNFDCKDPKNIGFIGQSGECKNKLIVDNKLLFDLVEKNKDYSHTKIYTGNLTNISHLFENKEVKYDISEWDVSNVTDMSGMFQRSSQFNQPLDKWSVSNVNNMRAMFALANNFNQPLNNWDVSNVTDMTLMFAKAEKFNQPLNDWNVHNVKDMTYMFAHAKQFNQPLNKWDVSNVADMRSMFQGASKFNQNLDRIKWNRLYSNDYDYIRCDTTK